MAKKNAYDFYCEEVLSYKTKVDIEYESNKLIAFHHTKPYYEFHVVIVPKKHIFDLVELDDSDLMWEVIKVVKIISGKFDLEKQGVRLINNMGKYQDTPHVHFHLVSGKKLKEM